MGGILPPPPTPLITTTTSTFSLNNSKMVNPVTLEFCNIQQHSIRDIRSTFGFHNSHQSPDIGQNSDERIFNFQISVQSLIKENCHNSRTSDAIDMKLGPVTKLDKGNKTTSKKLDDDIITENRDVIVNFRIFDQFGAVRRPDSGNRVCLQKLCFQ